MASPLVLAPPLSTGSTSDDMHKILEEDDWEDLSPCSEFDGLFIDGKAEVGSKRKWRELLELVNSISEPEPELDETGSGRGYV